MTAELGDDFYLSSSLNHTVHRQLIRLIFPLKSIMHCLQSDS